MATAVLYELAALSSFLFNLTLCDGIVPSGGVKFGEAGGGDGFVGFSLLRKRSHTATLPHEIDLTLRMSSFMQSAAQARLPGRRRPYYFSNKPGADVLQNDPGVCRVLVHGSQLANVTLPISIDFRRNCVVPLFFLCDGTCCDVDCCNYSMQKLPLLIGMLWIIFMLPCCVCFIASRIISYVKVKRLAARGDDGGDPSMDAPNSKRRQSTRNRIRQRLHLHSAPKEEPGKRQTLTQLMERLKQQQMLVIGNAMDDNERKSSQSKVLGDISEKMTSSVQSVESDELVDANSDKSSTTQSVDIENGNCSLHSIHTVDRQSTCSQNVNETASVHSQLDVSQSHDAMRSLVSSPTSFKSLLQHSEIETVIAVTPNSVEPSTGLQSEGNYGANPDCESPIKSESLNDNGFANTNGQMKPLTNINMTSSTTGCGTYRKYSEDARRKAKEYYIKIPTHILAPTVPNALDEPLVTQAQVHASNANSATRDVVHEVQEEDDSSLAGLSSIIDSERTYHL